MRLKETITPPRHVILILLDSGLRIEIPMSELCYQIGLESVDDIPQSLMDVWRKHYVKQQHETPGYMLSTTECISMISCQSKSPDLTDVD